MEGYPVRIQRVQRTGTCSYYVNFPVALAEAIQARKAEQWEWLLEDKNTLVFQRSKPLPRRKPTAPASP
jgi:hypothetical protein